jgi:DNA-binding transcriptional MerR regulator
MPSGKGRNVYYSNADFLVLSVMEHLLSIGLNFEMCHVALETLRKREPWLFEESVTEDKMKRLMFLLSRSPEQPLQLMEFDQQAALEALCQGQTVIPFWGDRVHQQLTDNLNSFSSVAKDC